MSSSDSYSEYVDAVNSCLSQAQTLGLNETNVVISTLATTTTRSPSRYTSSPTKSFGSLIEVSVSYLPPPSYRVGQIWLDCSALLSSELPVFKVSLDVTPLPVRWWVLDSLPLIFNPYVAIQQGLAAVAPISLIPLSSYKRELLLVTVDGQTSFVLPSIPTSIITLSLEVNGVAYTNPSDFTLSGSFVTWLNTFTLKTSDSVYAIYS